MTTITGRWVYGDARTYYPWQQCRYCGKAGETCHPVGCLACNTRQCHGNGSGNGTCKICVYGWLPGWSRSSQDTSCGYRGCSALAVANAPRVKRTCIEHLNRATVGSGNSKLTLSKYITTRIEHRDSGQGWERFQWVDLSQLDKMGPQS